MRTEIQNAALAAHHAEEARLTKNHRSEKAAWAAEKNKLIDDHRRNLAEAESRFQAAVSAHGAAMKQRLSEMHANEVKYSRHISDLLEMQTADEVRH